LIQLTTIENGIALLHKPGGFRLRDVRTRDSVRLLLKRGKRKEIFMPFALFRVVRRTRRFINSLDRDLCTIMRCFSGLSSDYFKGNLEKPDGEGGDI
jgi:hypothetical protein